MPSKGASLDPSGYDAGKKSRSTPLIMQKSSRKGSHDDNMEVGEGVTSGFQHMPYLDMPLFTTAEGSDEAALVRLGAATAILWQRIPPEVQNQLLDLSSRVGGLPNAHSCGVSLLRLIQAHDGLHTW